LQRHKLREYGTKEARKRLFSNLYLNTFPASTANPLGAARPTHFSGARCDLQRVAATFNDGGFHSPAREVAPDSRFGERADLARDDFVSPVADACM
jgi:hypothetical protein